MRTLLVLLFVATLSTMLFVPRADASLAKCTTEAGHTACVYPDEPEYVECVKVDGRAPVCVVDPCGTTSCF